MAARLSKAYLLSKVLRAGRHEVVVYLYEGVISHLTRAKGALGEGRSEAAGQAIERAISTLIGLSGSLNYTAGNTLTLKLDAIYNYLIESLTLANNTGDVAAIETCIDIVNSLYDAWQQAAVLEAQPATAQAGAQVFA